jgi:hypothetical protein
MHERGKLYFKASPALSWRRAGRCPAPARGYFWKKYPLDPQKLLENLLITFLAVLF